MTEQRNSVLPEWMPTVARLSGFLWSAREMMRAGGLPEIGLYFEGGLGDDILCSAVARELKQRGTRKIWLLTAFPTVFVGNQDLVAVPADFRMIRLCRMLRVPCRHLDYPSPPPRHLIATLCAAAGVTGDVALRPYVFIDAAEKQRGKVLPRPQIAVQTSSMSAKYPMLNKQWPPERFQAVVDALRGEYDFVQLGSPSDPGLQGCLDLRGKSSVRETAAILAASQQFLGLVGGLMHLARAVDCRAVIVYGGREHPSQSGYPANENLYWDGACSPCWKRNDCDFERKCMSEILPDAVIAAIGRQAARHGMPLEVEVVAV